MLGVTIFGSIVDFQGSSKILTDLQEVYIAQAVLGLTNVVFG